MEYFDIVNLVSGHSLIYGGLSPKKNLTKFIEATKDVKKAVEKFGLFEVASPNFSAYYPEVSISDLTPDDEDFVYPIFRGLSEVIVHKQINPIDFSKPGILKASLPLFIGQTVYANHDAQVGSDLGVVMDAFWEAAYKVDDIEIPAGINLKLKIDGKTNPKIARGLSMSPPSIHSGSATVAFAFVKSHEEMADEEFWKQLGSYDKNGELIRRVVTKVKKYNEYSLVTHGADPFAQKIVDGKITNPTYADVSYNSETGKAPTLYFDYKQDLNEVSLAERTIPNKSNNNETSKSMNEHLITLATAYGLKASDFADDKALLSAINDKKAGIDAQVASLSTLQTEVTELKGKLTTAEKDKATAETALTQLQASSAEATKALTAYHEEAVRLHKLANDGKEDPKVIETLKASGFDATKLLIDQYTKEVEAKFSLECQDCHSNNVSRQTTVSNADEEGKKKTGSTKVALTNEETMRELALENRNKVKSFGIPSKVAEAKK